VEDFKQRVSELADLMSEFSLSEASLEGDGWKIAFKKAKAAAPAAEGVDALSLAAETVFAPVPAPPVDSKPSGTPINSPMNGIFYNAPSPSSPPFVKEGEQVTVGQVVGLIEAMKVFNEIVSPVSGTVQKMAAENAQLVQQGDPLLYIG
jgi:acetyl-CoA carboxylase biotin carboxyl carrier protein